MTPPATVSLRAEVGRKALHLGTAVLPMCLAWGLLTPTALRWTLTVAVGVAVTIEGLRRASATVERQFTALVGGLLRAHERTALTGATWLALAMALVAWGAPPRAAIAALWAAAVGDACAALVGRAVQRQAGAGKTWAGSAAATVSTALGCWWLAGASPAMALGLGLVAAAAERPRLALDDNLRVALAVAVAASLGGLH